MTFTAANTTFSAFTDIVVIDTDSEFADMSNPRGEIHGHAAYVVAENDKGERRCFHTGTHRWENQVLPFADALAAALNTRAANGKLPVGFAAWREDRPCYGSDAYIASGQEEQDAFAEREEY